MCDDRLMPALPTHCPVSSSLRRPKSLSELRHVFKQLILLSHVFAERLLDFFRSDALPVVQASENAVDDFLSRLFAVIPDESIEKVLTGKGVIDFRLFI